MKNLIGGALLLGVMAGGFVFLVGGMIALSLWPTGQLSWLGKTWAVLWVLAVCWIAGSSFGADEFWKSQAGENR